MKWTNKQKKQLIWYLVILFAIPLLYRILFAEASYPITPPGPAERRLEAKEVIIPPILERIAQCESGNRQFDEKGQVLLGKINPQDRGRFQISWRYHSSTIKALGINIDTWEGNTAYALWLYEKQGTTPWNWSRACWSNAGKLR